VLSRAQCCCTPAHLLTPPPLLHSGCAVGWLPPVRASLMTPAGGGVAATEIHHIQVRLCPRGRLFSVRRIERGSATNWMGRSAARLAGQREARHPSVH